MAKKFILQVVTPERGFFDEEVDRVEFKTSEGDIGVYEDHTPLTTPLADGGMLTILQDGKEKKAAIHGGFVEITPEKVTLLTDAAEWPEEIDKKRAEEARIRAERRLKAEEEDMNEIRAKSALTRSLVRIDASVADSEEDDI